jgi:hypothetical protein
MAKRNKGNVKEQKRRYALKYRERELERNRLKSTAYRRRLGIKPRVERIGCLVPGCDGKHRAYGYCQKHSQRFRDHGDPLYVPPPPPSPEERFWAKVDKVGHHSSCWLWTAAAGYGGYGTFQFDGKNGTAHRFAYVLFNGPIPKGMHVHHKCGNKLCVNPAHLELLTASEHQAGHWKERKRAIEHYETFRKQEARKMVDSLRLLGARFQ